ncbi:DUF58 domain-containing protein [Peredibacter starrii]|uniref:DUF58 domain-containing protein n=1 Tax=Peredibacter starrii TaxID=28202 RepID=A0AAX4HJN3_9BACT|nr:DUF58 domain-containing protein [Peredibacter starrii]WPU63409.1 DUF58 domain-containing protein [Peredibacter starrii]
MKKERIYILPTRMGGYLNGLIFLMFLLSVGYSNNLLLIFTLFLFGLNLIWVIQTHFHLHGLKFGSVQVTDNFAEDLTSVSIHWKKAPEGPLSWDLLLDKVPVKTFHNTKERSDAHLVFPKRGVYQFSKLKVSTSQPFGLYRAWITFNVDVTAYAYPVKAKDLGVLPSTPSHTEGEISTMNKGPHDVWNLGPYQGEESRKISWKHYARSGELVVKEGEELQEAEVKFELHGPTEGQLSQLATQLVYCSDKSIPFSLKTSSGKTEHQLRECLKELAKC